MHTFSANIAAQSQLNHFI